MVMLISCKTPPDSNRHYDDNNPNRVYRLRLNPPAGSQYAYTVTRSTEFRMEVDGKKVDNKNRSTIDIVYSIGRDSAGNFVLDMAYNKIHLYTKTGDTEEEEDADKATGSADAVERMLGILKGASLRAVVSPAGQIKSLQGDEAIKNQLLAGFSPGDVNARNMASQQWDQQVKNGMIRNNMEELFRIFPDSAVHVGDRWKMNSTKTAEVPLTTRNSFQLKEIVDGTAVIRSEGEISSSETTSQLNGANYTSDLKGKEEGSLDMDATTGMLLSSTSDSEIEGTISSMGRDIPVKIKISMKMEGRKLK